VSAALRTYRVLVRGVLDGLTDESRARLLADVDAHDLLSARFTDEGTLAYDRSLGPVSFRVIVQVEGGPTEEDDASAAGQLALLERLETLGVGCRRLRATVTSVDDMRIHRR
jgi:hypothetical protein